MNLAEALIIALMLVVLFGGAMLGWSMHTAWMTYARLANRYACDAVFHDEQFQNMHAAALELGIEEAPLTKLCFRFVGSHHEDSARHAWAMSARYRAMVPYAVRVWYLNRAA
jgi:hypothetical protein